MATLTSTKIKNTYDALLKASDNDAIGSSAKQITDGLGNGTPLYISTTQIGIGVTPEATYDLHVYSNAKVGGNLTVTGDLTVEGTTTTIDTQTLTVEDPLIEVASNNTSTDAVDIGWYGKYAPSGTTLYAGLFRDTGDSKFKLFRNLEEQPTTTVNTSGTGYTKATLVIGGLEATTGDFTDTVTVDGDIEVENSSGFGRIEIGGSSGGYIDLKSPFSDDFDLRLYTAGTNAQINALNGELDITANTNINLQYQGTDVLVMSSTGVAVTGDLTVDTDTLFVDSTNNRVGILTTNPSDALNVDDDVSGSVRITIDNANAAGFSTLRFEENDTERAALYYSNAADTFNLQNNTNSGNLRLQTTNSIGTTTNGIIINGSSEAVELYYAGTKKFETTSGGISVTGTGSFTGQVTIPETPVADTDAASKGYVDTVVGNNNELSEVLANGNTTSGTDIAVSSGDDITFVDDSKAIFGTDGDLEIYHYSITDTAQITINGKLDIRANTLQLKNYSGETYLRAASNGALRLYYDGVEKFITTSTGISVTDTVSATTFSGQLDGTISSTTTATTQTQGDNSTKVATTAYVDSAIGGQDTLAEVLANGNTTGGTDIAITSGDKITNFTSTGIDDNATSTSLTIDSSGRVSTSEEFIATEGNRKGFRLIANNGNWEMIASTSANHLILHSESLGSDYVTIKGGGQVQFNDYGSGSFTGTATYRLAVDSSGDVIEIPIGDGAVDGSGTANYVAKWSDTDTITNSVIYDDGTNVGIGTPPSAKLDVNGDVYIRGGGYLYVDTLAGYSSGVITLNSNTNFIVPSGNVGIGQTSLSSTRKLHIAGSQGYDTASGGNGTGGIYIKGGTAGDNNYSSGIGFSIATGTSGISGVQTEGSDADRMGLAFFTHGSGTGTAASSEAMRIESNGNVGIGTTNPQSNLHISTSSTNAPIRLQNDNGSGSTANFVLQTDSSGLGNNGFGIYDVANSAYRLVINGSGNVGIGTDSPDARFSVVTATANSTASRIGGLEYSGNQRGLTIKTFQSGGGDDCGVEFNAAEGLSGYGSFIFKADTAERMRIDSSGSVGIGVTPHTSTFKTLEIGNGDNVGNISNDPFYNDFSFGSGCYYNSGWKYAKTGEGAALIRAYGYNGQFFFQRASSGTKGNAITWDIPMTIDTSGNVGIGTTSPTVNKLQVEGSTDGLGIAIKNTGTGGRTYGIQSTGGTSGYGQGKLAFVDEAVGARMVIDSSGNVGIGTSSPDNKLTIADSTTLSVGKQWGLDFQDTGKGSPQAFIYAEGRYDTNYNTDLIFGTIGTTGTATERVRIDNSGNVGIGTDSPSSPLHIKAAEGGMFRIENSSGNIGAYTEFDAGYANQYYYQLGGGVKIALSTNGNSYFNGGNVGIGTTSPNQEGFGAGNRALSVKAPSSGGVANLELIGLGNADNDELGYVNFMSQSATNSAASIVGLRHTSDTSGKLVFRTANVERMRITELGKVDIGTRSYVGSSTSTTRLYIEGNSPGHNLAQLQMAEYSAGLMFYLSSSTATSRQACQFYNNRIDSSPTFVGSIQINSSSTAFNTSSDYRLKENVVEMTGALDRVGQLKPSRFNFIGHEEIVDGFLAHEVSDIVPEAITGTKDEVDAEGNPVYQGIDQSKLVPLLVGAIKELKAEIETLKAQINN